VLISKLSSGSLFEIIFFENFSITRPFHFQFSLLVSFLKKVKWFFGIQLGPKFWLTLPIFGQVVSRGAWYHRRNGENKISVIWWTLINHYSTPCGKSSCQNFSIIDFWYNWRFSSSWVKTNMHYLFSLLIWLLNFEPQMHFCRQLSK